MFIKFNTQERHGISGGTTVLEGDMRIGNLGLRLVSSTFILNYTVACGIFVSLAPDVPEL